MGKFSNSLLGAIVHIALSSVSAAVWATPTEQFTCEMIKDKPTRLRCVQAREAKSVEDRRLSLEREAERERVSVEKAKADQEAAEREAVEVQRQAAKQKQFIFVEDAKRRIAARLKDPDSAKFTAMNLHTNRQTGKRTLCGMVNAKNSYGGYVGATGFHVTEEAVKRPIHMVGDGSNSKDFDTLMAAIAASKEYEGFCITDNRDRDSQRLE